MRIRHTLVLAFLLYILIYWSYNSFYSKQSYALQHIPTEMILHPQHRQLASKVCFLGLPYQSSGKKSLVLEDLAYSNETLALDEEHLKFAHKLYSHGHNVKEYGAAKYHQHHQ